MSSGVHTVSPPTSNFCIAIENRWPYLLRPEIRLRDSCSHEQYLRLSEFAGSTLKHRRMAQVSLSPHTFATMAPQDNDSIGSELFAPRALSSIIPEPLPPFVFPMRLPNTLPEQTTPTRHSPAGHTESLSARRSATHTRPPQQISINALPNFEFPASPADSISTSSGPSTHSPATSLPIPTRAGGHRRNGSEYIGGDGTATGPGLMSSSPTKGEGSLPSVSNSRRGPPGGRRGHAHRRSGAISSHDVSAIIRPPSELNSPRSGSAPATPSDPTTHPEFLLALDKSAPQLAAPVFKSSTLQRSTRRESLPNMGQSRPRVGFSDTVEFIPRPLSTISSETSSSLSTIRASHSVTDSISSIVSSSASNTPSKAKTPILSDRPSEYPTRRARPMSAGAILDSFQTTSTSLSQARAEADSPSATTPAGTFSEMAFRRLSRRPVVTERMRVDELASQFAGGFLGNDAISMDMSPATNNIRRLRGEQDDALPISRPRSSPEPKASKEITKRQKKGRSWADTFLPRMGRSRSSNDASEPVLTTPTKVRHLAPMDDSALGDVNFDEDNTLTIRNPKYLVPRQARTDFSTWEPRQPSSFQPLDDGSAVIDLDAALAAPAHTPGSSEEGDSGSQSGFSSAKRRMHSGGVSGGFTGPGMHYHRRAESAPEMAPVDYLTFGLRNSGSNTAMADVFEEEEEDEDHAKAVDKRRSSEQAAQDEELKGLGVQIVDTEVGESPKPRKVLTEEQVGPMDVSQCPSNDKKEVEALVNTSAATVTQADAEPVEIVDPTEEPRFSVVTKSSDGSTITPSLINEPLRSGSLPAPMEYAIPRSIQYAEMPQTPSSVSSPDFAHSSFDVPRLHTATSSITDRTTWSGSRAGGAGHGSTYSSEDVPSLTSSASTMISSYPPRISSTSVGTRSSGERAMSFSAAQLPRTRPSSAGKRASLASLSRIMGSSHSEKSKLSIESRAGSDDTEKTAKKKGHRISRLMKFWKPKEKPEKS